MRRLARLWAAHDRSARDLLPVWYGREIDKTDGMLLLFDTASDAVGYALAYQQALNQLTLPLKARAGLLSAPSRCARTALPTSRWVPSRSRSRVWPRRPPHA